MAKFGYNVNTRSPNSSLHKGWDEIVQKYL